MSTLEMESRLAEDAAGRGWLWWLFGVSVVCAVIGGCRARNKPANEVASETEYRPGEFIRTIRHDGHLFVVVGDYREGVLHHPGCPCLSGTNTPAPWRDDYNAQGGQMPLRPGEVPNRGNTTEGEVPNAAPPAPANGATATPLMFYSSDNVFVTNAMRWTVSTDEITNSRPYGPGIPVTP